MMTVEQFLELMKQDLDVFAETFRDAHGPKAGMEFEDFQEAFFEFQEMAVQLGSDDSPDEDTAEAEELE